MKNRKKSGFRNRKDRPNNTPFFASLSENNKELSARCYTTLLRESMSKAEVAYVLGINIETAKKILKDILDLGLAWVDRIDLCGISGSNCEFFTTDPAKKMEAKV